MCKTFRSFKIIFPSSMQTDTFKDSPPHPLMLIIINLIIKLLFEITLSSSEVHITMGSFDGAEIWELIGIHILSLLSNKFNKQSTGLYRDDWLVLLRNTSKQKTVQIQKGILQIFKNTGFKIKIKTNLHIVDFLDLMFNLLDGMYKAYKKPNNQLLYVNTSSNHPPQIIKQPPISISNRLSSNASNKQVFDMSKGEYEKALRESG